MYENNKTLYIKERLHNKIRQYQIPLRGGSTTIDNTTTGHLSYNTFYRTLGKDKIENLKLQVEEMHITTEAEQLHWVNPLYQDQPIYKQVYQFDVNSSFPNGIMLLPNRCIDLQDYTMMMYHKREQETDPLKRIELKNMLNMLVGYFERVTAFRPLRHQIIYNSNSYILSYRRLIEKNGGTVYLINVDSIICDSIGASIMNDYLGKDIGRFKIETQADKLYIRSNVVYQIGNKLKYAGKTALERENTDLFLGNEAYQLNNFIEGTDYDVTTNDEELSRLCKYYEQPVNITVKNILGEIIAYKIYYLGG